MKCRFVFSRYEVIRSWRLKVQSICVCLPLQKIVIKEDFLHKHSTY